MYSKLVTSPDMLKTLGKPSIAFESALGLCLSSSCWFLTGEICWSYIVRMYICGPSFQLVISLNLPFCRLSNSLCFLYVCWSYINHMFHSMNSIFSVLVFMLSPFVSGLVSPHVHTSCTCSTCCTCG